MNEWPAAALIVTLLLGTVAFSTALASRALVRRREPDPDVDPASLGLAAEPVSFGSRDRRTTLRGWWIPAAHAAGTVVVCGGQRGSLDGDLPIYAPMLHEAGFNTLFFDWRAHGRSDGHKVTFGVYEKEDLLGALDFLAGRGVVRVGLLGLSMGANVALIVSALSDRVGAVVCDGLPARLHSTLVGYMVERRAPRRLAAIAAHLVLVWASFFEVGGNLFHADAWRWAAHLGDTPVLLIHGDRDPLVSVDEIEAVFHRLSGRKVLWRVPAAAHREAYAKRPQEYAGHVTAWLGDNL